jgi:hypothetical protein
MVSARLSPSHGIAAWFLFMDLLTPASGPTLRYGSAVGGVRRWAVGGAEGAECSRPYR